jgi:hypothetical protein
MRALTAALAAAALAPAAAAAAPAADVCAARPCGAVAAVVRAGGQREPLADVAVVAVPASSRRLRAVEDPASDRPAWLRQARSDAAGAVSLAAPAGLVRLVVVAPGFDRLEQVVEVRAGATTEVRLYPRPQGWNPYRTVVRDAKATPRAPDVAARTLSREEIATLPGSQGDPLRALQNLPGVARTPGGLGLLVLRGASPNQSQVFVGEHPVPRAFHVLSLASVVPADVLERVEYVPGNFDSRYGNATGGVVVLAPRRGRTRGLHGFGEVDLAAASALVEGPLGRRGGSFIVAGQRGYVDAVLRAAQAALGEQDLLLPRYFDYQAMVDHPLPGGGTISARVLGSGDRVRLRGGAGEGGFDFRNDFHRVDVVVRRRLGDWRFLVSPAFRYDVGRREIPEAATLQRRRDYVTSLRAEAARRLSDRFELVFGADTQVDAFSAYSRAPEVQDPSAAPVEVRARGTETSLGAYATAHLRLGPLLLTPGLRASGFVVGEDTEFGVDPRLHARLELGERWSLRAAVGSYTQARVVRYVGEARLVPQGVRLGSGYLIVPAFFNNFEPLVVLEPVEDTLRAIRALQASAGVAHELAQGLTAELTGFLRVQDNGVPPALLGDVLRGSSGRTYGVELLLRRPLTRWLYGWLAYTYMRSEVVQRGLLDAPARRFAADFDQRHNLALIFSVKLPRGWQVGGRFRLVSGLPYTPILGGVQYPGSFAPILGPYNAARFPPFHQLDLRVDKRWVLRRAGVTAFLDVQNVYNRQNVEVYLYSYDFRDVAGAVGLPIFPSVGVRVDF